ncbi:Smr/MutS family protein [Rhodosalinus sp. FB01]|uniref:Smr/MutS family protein n=1 Tax=Rhodosalinus sp. FB01 TaxID=3239194 RepID=UPI003523EB72
MTRRRLSSEDLALWRQVARSAERLHADRPPRDEGERADRAPSPAPRRSAGPAVPAGFRIGGAAPASGGARDLAPDLSARVEAAPLRMDRKTHQKMKRGRLDPEARIDLHGMTLDEAHPALVSFILASQAAGRRLVLVITGKGRRAEDQGPIPRRQGVLRHQLPHWLSTPPLSQAVLQVREAHLKHGGGGAYYVYLRRR